MGETGSMRDLCVDNEVCRVGILGFCRDDGRDLHWYTQALYITLALRGCAPIFTSLIESTQGRIWRGVGLRNAL